MPDLNDEFDVFRGDLLYGHSRDRGTALAYLKANHEYGDFIEAAMDAGAWVTVDNFNVPLESDYSAARAEDLWAEIKGKRDQTKSHLDTELLPQYDVSAHSELTQKNQEYQDKMKAFLKQLKQSKLSPSGSLNAPADKLDREGWSDLAKNRYYLAIRRACKFGIEHVAANTAAGKIHFVLNRFDQGTGWLDLLEKKVVTAPTRTTMVITYSEIRYVYKHWAQFSARTQFYRFTPSSGDPSVASSFPSCPAPWEDDSRYVDVPRDSSLDIDPQRITLRQLWNGFYTKYKAKAYRDKVIGMKRTSAGYTPRRSDVDNWLDLGNICLDNDADAAIDWYKKCVTAMRG